MPSGPFVWSFWCCSSAKLLKRSGSESQAAQFRLGNCERQAESLPMLGKGNESNGWKTRTSIMRALIARPPFRPGHSLDEWTVELALDSEVLPSANGES